MLSRLRLLFIVSIEIYILNSIVLYYNLIHGEFLFNNIHYLN